jgi:hypothetical protein
VHQKNYYLKSIMNHPNYKRSRMHHQKYKNISMHHHVWFGQKTQSTRSNLIAVGEGRTYKGVDESRSYATSAALDEVTIQALDAFKAASFEASDGSPGCAAKTLEARAKTFQQNAASIRAFASATAPGPVLATAFAFASASASALHVSADACRASVSAFHVSADAV